MIRPLATRQMGLFDDPGVATPAELLARSHAEAATLAARLPPGVRFGTSSWSFPGWSGIVYGAPRTATALARDGLGEYARHPLFGTVGIDRGFYAPIPERDLERYKAQLPAGFPCCAKAPAAVTSAVQAIPGAPPRPNPDYLSRDRFIREMLDPFRRAFAGHLGPFILQFPPPPAGVRANAAEFARRLDEFLAALPRGLRYAVELRDPALLGGDYAQVLAAHGVAHVYSYAATMPLPAAQAEQVPVEGAIEVVIRLLMRPGSRYAARRDAFTPFDRLADPDEEMRDQVAEIIRRSCRAGRAVFVLVNNKAEGSAPLTIRALALRLVTGS